MSTRYIHSRTNSTQISDLLQMLFVKELMVPSHNIWLISPWLSDIYVIDNTTNKFITLEPDWAGKKVKISEVILKLLRQGTTISIAVKPVEHNEYLFTKLKSETKDEMLPLKLYLCGELHEKGLLGDDYYLCGSMNFTYGGITLNEEALQLITDEKAVAENRLVFTKRWSE